MNEEEEDNTSINMGVSLCLGAAIGCGFFPLPKTESKTVYTCEKCGYTTEE